MSAHESERLWEYARGRLAEPAAREVRAHVASCARCAEELKAAEAGALAFTRLAAPKRPAPAWSAVDDRVLAAARAQIEGGLRQRFFGAFRIERWAIAGGLVTAAMLAFVVFRPAKPEVEAPAAQPTAQLAAPSAPAPVPVPSLTSPALEADIRTARVVSSASAKRDDAGARELAAEDTVSEGQRVATQGRGDAVFALPEGSAIDLRPASALTFAALASDRVKLEVHSGEVVVAASHREGRTFEVSAGDVSVTVVGTRFSVSHAANATVIRVTEGRVRVHAQGGDAFVSAGEELTVTKRAAKKRTLSDDVQEKLAPLLARLEKVIQPMPKSRPAPSLPSPSKPRPGDVRANAGIEAGTLPPEDLAAPPVGTPEGTPDGTPEEWALPSLGSSADGGAASARDAGAVAVAAAKPASKRDAGVPWYRDPVESVSRWIDVDWNAPFPPAGMSVAEYRVRQMERLADAGRCKHALLRGDEWVKTFVVDAGSTDLNLYRLEEMTRARCLDKLGRREEARKIRAMWP